MAVKQNNTETSGDSSSVGSNTGTGTAGSVTTNATGGAAKILNTNVDAIGVGTNAEQPGCTSQGPTAKPKISVTAAMSGNGVSGVAKGANGNKASNMIGILQLIELVELKQQTHTFGPEILKIYRHIICQLSRLPMPRDINEMKIFKNDILKVGDFFGKANEKRVYMFYLHTVCQLMTQNDIGPPSFAVAVIFQLFTAEMVVEAVQSLLQQKLPDDDIRKTVRLLCEWLHRCNFCQNLNLWIVAILTEIREQQKLTLFDDIATENIENILPSLIVPLLRLKLAPVFFLMLSSANHTPSAFHKILSKLPKLVNILKQQSSNGEVYAEQSKDFLQKLADLLKALMTRFDAYDDQYKPLENVLKDIQPSSNYASYLNGGQGAQRDVENADEHDVDMLQNNAKVGLINLGNTCYMNSVLQALAMTKEFSREILLIQSKSPMLQKVQQQIALMLYSERYELCPARVMHAIRPPGFTLGLQQDSSEFLGYLLETLHEQEMSFRKKVIMPQLRTLKAAKQEEGDYLMEDIDNTDSSTHAVSRTESAQGQSHSHQHNEAAPTNIEASTIEKTFTGKLATTYKCSNCGWESRNVDSFRDLQLAFPEVDNDCASNYSVQDLIDYYCSPEKLYGDNQYYCEGCKQLSDAERYINVISAPKNLILTLKHFKYDQKYHMRAKLMHNVFHDEKVSVKVCSTETLEEVASVHYDLYAGVVHSGVSMDSGHYYTYASDASNEWYKFNDNTVTRSQSEELHNLKPPNTPYILFYQMCARSNEAPEATGSSTKVIKVEVPAPLAFNELPYDLREYVNHENYTYIEELKMRRFKNAAKKALQGSLQINGAHNRRNHFDDDEDDQPPSSGAGCGDGAMNFNPNRFVY